MVGRFFALIAALLICAAIAAGGEYYVDADNGDDAAAGSSPETAWRSLDRVNEAQLAAGDVVRFKRGGTWRGNLQPPASGLTFDAFGQGPMPRLLGSIDRTGEQHWTEESLGLWYTDDVAWRPNFFQLRQGMIWHAADDGDLVGGQQQAGKDDLDDAWDWWIDAENRRAYVKLDSNPGRVRIEVNQPFGDQEAIIGFSGANDIIVRNLELAYGGIGIGIWIGDRWRIEQCYLHDFVVDAIHANGPSFEQSPDNGIVIGCTLVDWNWKGYNLTQHNWQEWGRSEAFMGYGVHVFNGDDWRIVDNTLLFRNNYSGMDSTPIAFDSGGHAAEIVGNTMLGNRRIFGPSTGIMYWATEGGGDTSIRDNVIDGIGGMGIILQTFDRFEFAGDVIVAGNVLSDLCWGDHLDQEALRVWTQFDGAGEIRVARNTILGTHSGQHGHHGIRVRQSRATVVDNTVVGADRGVSIEAGSNVILAGNRSIGNRGPALAAGGTATVENQGRNAWAGAVEGAEAAGSDTILPAVEPGPRRPQD